MKNKNRRIDDLGIKHNKVKLVFTIVIFLFLIIGCSSTPYAKIGVGYKFSETDYHSKKHGKFDDHISARLELGVKNCLNLVELNCGVSHHSQYGTGWPVNNESEPYKTEIFIDYEFIWEN